MLYRRQRNLSPLLLTVVALTGLVVGFLAGRATAPAPTLARLVAPGVDHARQAAGALEIVALEYARAQQQQGAAVSYDAALRAARQAQAELGAAPLLNQLSPRAFREARTALAALAAAVEARQDNAAVQADVARAQQVLRELQTIASP